MPTCLDTERVSPSLGRDAPASGPIPVLFVANRAELWKGGQVNLVRLLDRLDRTRFRAVVCVPREGSVAVHARAAGLTVVVLPLVRLEWHRPDAWLRDLVPTARLRDLVRQHRVRLVYVDSPGHLLPARLACRGTGARVVWHAQTGAPTSFDGRFARLADHIISCSAATDRRFAGVTGRSVVVPNSVDCDRFSPEPGLASRSETCREFRLLYLGEISAGKGVLDLLRVFSWVSRKRDDVVLQIAGRGAPWAEAWWRLQARRLGVAPRVQWLGYVADPVACLRATDLFVFFSRSEGLSLALLEAMAVGLPVVASDIPPNVEALSGTGLTVSCADPRGAADALLALAGNSQRRAEFGRAARGRALAVYSMPGFVDAVERLFARWAETASGEEA